MNDNQQHNQGYDYWVKFASRCAVAVAVLLVSSKLWAWWLSSSASMLASATDSILDVLASLSSFVILSYALAPADKEHRFGHGKAENLAALMQASFVLGSATLLVFHGSERMMSPHPITHSTLAISVSILAIILTLALVAVQKYVVNKTGSIAISADSLHYQSDLLLNAGVILALLLSKFSYHYADGAFAVLVGVYLGYGSIKIAYHAVQDLLDRELDSDDRARIGRIIEANEQVIGYHQLRTRQAGKVQHIQFHLELDDELTLKQAHTIADSVEQAIIAEYPFAEVLIHQDPQSVVGSEQNHHRFDR
ncbi:cation diffusion facilitator family transporter [Thalassotalea ponticola]|uniref:cation diffusion facilitator family transporter n=1 Tax=Thalassotalea ponticola TaxID=1523392 RepID=UPI0025B4E038|nr:cation diffusion facilitator family transporter [Thalassotalea ponticola]MDN3652983.1 cation diffusion facilitator family transporter [Thalassotalea ponticola]